MLRARRRVRIVKAMRLPERGGRDLRVLAGLPGSTPVGSEILRQARVNGFPASGMLCPIKWCNSGASYLAAFLASRSRVLTRFVQECTLTAGVKPACGDEVVEGRPGDARDLGDRALRYAELEEVADLVLPAVEARHAQRPLRPSVVRAMRCLGRCAHGWACGCPSTRRISLTEQYVLNDHGRHQKAHVRRLRSANHAQERDPGPAAETLRPAPGKAPRRR